MSSTVENATEIRPFRVDMPDEAIADLRRRIAAPRWPSRELVTDRSQGVQLATMQELARYWAADYDWRACEARLNALPQFTTEIDGVDIHFIHVKSQHKNALPLLITHGWPGSVIELLELGPLTDPTAHGGGAEDALDRLAQAWAELMPPPRLRVTAPRAATWAPGHRRDGSYSGRPRPSSRPRHSGRAASATSWSRPRGRTIGYALLDSPVSLAAWMLDHDTDAYEKISRAFVDGQPSGGLTRDHILDNIAVLADGYRGLGGAVLLGERTSPGSRGRAGSSAGQAPGRLHHIPRRDLRGPAQLGREGVPHPHEATRGGHFAAWEEPEWFATEIRAAFKPLR